ncbi:hypothetical protein [Thermococcus sp. ES12]|uniref:hypothetical protein n=1 Tax=Thermococcus sp. ES12 TaxID=1638246 RepID=UPI00142FE1B7|nr:hypothetical protein [Thermococcus sp. ES12]NJE76446.1 hypothetical protein [Thermococcus sp. ES12]
MMFMEDIFDILSLSKDGNLGELTIVLVFLFIAMYIVNILLKLGQFERLTIRRRRTELWRVFQKYHEFNQLIHGLEREFATRAGFSRSPYRSVWYWMPLVLSGVLLALLITLGGITFNEAAKKVAIIWSILAVALLTIALTQFDYSSFEWLGHFFDFSLGMLWPTYLFPLFGYFNEFEKGFSLAIFSWIPLLLVLLVWFPLFKRRAILAIWYSQEFSPKRKMLLVKLPLVEVRTPEAIFVGRISDVFDQNYLIIRDGIRDVLIPWSKISYIEIIGGFRVR